MMRFPSTSHGSDVKIGPALTTAFQLFSLGGFANVREPLVSYFLKEEGLSTNRPRGEEDVTAHDLN